MTKLEMRNEIERIEKKIFQMEIEANANIYWNKYSQAKNHMMKTLKVNCVFDAWGNPCPRCIIPQSINKSELENLLDIVRMAYDSLF